MIKQIKSLLLLLIVITLFTGCNASLLMNNGEISKPSNGNSISKDDVVEFKGEAPTGVNATKSYFADKINIRWNSVTGADYYTLEKTSHTTPTVESDAKWTALNETTTATSFTDDEGLLPSVYYSYRVTAHTYTGATGVVSASSTGTILTEPTKIEASKGTDLELITLTWNQTPNSESYNIYKSSSETLTGSPSEFLVSVNATETSLEQSYSYQIISGKEEGKELFFAISAIGPTGEETAISLPRSGYTKVLGAPQQPNSYISKGEYLNSIIVQFISPTEDSEHPFDYVIKRSSPGSAESEVFSTLFGDSLVKNENGYYVFEDTDVYDNVEYTYSIVASDSSNNKSEARVDTGYVLSPVTNLLLSADDRGSEIGYKATFDLPVGYANDNYVYKVVTTLKDGTVGASIEIPSSEIAEYDFFYPVKESPTVEEEQKEIRSISITVSNGSYDTVSVVSNKIKDLDYAIESISATQNNKPQETDEPNSSGVYPVHIKFVTMSNANQTITRKGSDGSVVYLPVEASANGVYSDTDTVPLVKYDYYIDNTDELGRTIEGERNVIPHAVDSYGSITATTYKNVFESVGLKPWEKQDYVPSQYRSWWKNTTLAIMIGYGNAPDLSTQMKALGDAQANDHSSRNGLIRYSASMEGIGGQIYFYYTDFGESENFYINGNYEMHVNASGTGSASSNTSGLTIRGMYPGFCSLQSISVSGKAFKGTYIFTYKYTDGAVEMRVDV